MIHDFGREGQESSAGEGILILVCLIGAMVGVGILCAGHSHKPKFGNATIRNAQGFWNDGWSKRAQIIPTTGGLRYRTEDGKEHSISGDFRVEWDTTQVIGPESR